MFEDYQDILKSKSTNTTQDQFNNSSSEREEKWYFCGERRYGWLRLDYSGPLLPKKMTCVSYSWTMRQMSSEKSKEIVRKILSKLDFEEAVTKATVDEARKVLTQMSKSDDRKLEEDLKQDKDWWMSHVTNNNERLASYDYSNSAFIIWWMSHNIGEKMKPCSVPVKK